MLVQEPRGVSPWEIEEESLKRDIREGTLKLDKELKRRLIVEQYKQAAEEYRLEDKNTWQIFSIVLGLNGILLGAIKKDYTILISSLAGMISVAGCYCIITRSRLYQKQRLLIAEKIQEITDIFPLYFSMSLNDFFKRNYPLEPPLKLHERLGGRNTMKYILMSLFIIWFVAFIYGLDHYGPLYLVTAKGIVSNASSTIEENIRWRR